MRKTFILITAFASTLNLALAATPAAVAKPSPALTPREVVQLQITALKAVDHPTKDAGFATVFRFTSPGNRAQTGPLPRFSRMIRDGFGEMINHKSARLLDTIQQADEALQPVEIISLGGKRYQYVFVLRRQDDENCRACWLTDGVIPQDERSQSQEL
ncbi:MAG: DUF4864 domain-containing protein [Pseudomonadota bacterium]